MKQFGPYVSKIGPETTGFKDLKAVYWNQPAAVLYEQAIQRGEGQVTEHGPFVAITGQHTGRSPKDKFVVRDAATEDQVWWDNNNELSPEHFDVIYQDFMEHAKGKELFAQDLYGGADPEHRINTRIFSEYSWHALFIQHLLILPKPEDYADFEPGFTIVNLPSFKADPERHGCRSETIIACDLERKLFLIGGSSYAGENKKSVFTMLNWLLPAKDVLPMHCSINVGDEGDAAIFFGLSGTGKTTLSADPKRVLLGDDEHGWSDKGVFNFEGGCYAKTIKLREEAEPEIFATTRMFGTVLENVVIDPETRALDLDDDSLTENTRAAYPLDYLDNVDMSGMAGQPKNIIMLTADAFGVMPPIARLTAPQAMYHFLSGYTAKVAGTEKGVTEPEATFSTCFGAPFIPRHPTVYGNMLRDLIKQHDVTCWLVNTGWTGGKYGVGERMPIKATRALLDAALGGSLNDVDMRIDPYFGFAVPVAVDGIDTHILNPRDTWDDKAAYDAQAAQLVDMFVTNFEPFADHVEADVKMAAPSIKAAAE